MKMTFLKLFLICTFKDPNLAEKFTNLAENLKKSLTLFMEFVYSKSVQMGPTTLVTLVPRNRQGKLHPSLRGCSSSPPFNRKALHQG